MASARQKFAAGDRAVEGLLGSTELRLQRAYRVALDEVRGLLASAYTSYGDATGALTYAEMSKYNRMASLEKELVAALRDLGHTVRIESLRLGRDTYSEAFYRAGWVFETGSEIDLGFGMLSRETIEAAVNLPLSGQSWNRRIAADNVERIRGVRSTITQGLIRGDSYPQMSRAARKYTLANAARTTRVVRTEAHRCQSEGTLSGMHHADAEGLEMVKVWLATLDSRTRSDHADMDGVSVPVKEDFELPDGSMASAPGMSGSAAQDINCRCTMVAEFGDIKADQRRIRGEGVQPDMTFRDWQASREAREPSRVINPTNLL